MKRLFAAVALSVMLLPAVAQANDYVFACRDTWNREIDVPVTADSIEAAREILRTEKKYKDDYSLCSYRREIKVKHPKHHIVPQPESGEGNTPAPDSGVPMD